MMRTTLSRLGQPSVIALFFLAAVGCGGDISIAHAAPALLECNDSIKTGFKFDADTTVLLVKQFHAGDTITLSSPPAAKAPVASADVCLVKLLVGPGNPGPEGAFSTTKGIGIQVWLPAKSKWDQRLRHAGGGGWVGGVQSLTDKVDLFFDLAYSTPLTGPGYVFSQKGSVGVDNDKGHLENGGNASFAMNPDGTVSAATLRDFARANHEAVVRAKALATAYYGHAPKYSYFQGASSGGREALRLAQEYPNDFDGIVSGSPAINWTEFQTSGVYAQLVIQRDLGGIVPSDAQFKTVEDAALNSCDMVGGVHLGYVLDPSQCKYDPTHDPSVLCKADGGTNTTAGCVTPTQAQAFNKFWYGQTTDGSVPSPAIDNGWGDAPSGKHLWYGTTRGTTLTKARSKSSGDADVVALILQNSKLASPQFKNASGNGADGWKSLSYAQLADAADRGKASQALFSKIDTNNPDLSAFKAHGGKLISYTGLADDVITPIGTIKYYDRVVAAMGSVAAVQQFYKFYLIPAMAHMVKNGSSNPAALPPIPDQQVWVDAITNWVEKGIAPGDLPATSITSAAQPVASTAPTCAYPQKLTFVAGDLHSAQSYACK